jgi:hypothetical protein
VKLRFVSVAARELSEAITYYESIAPPLGERFRADIESTLDRIIANPVAWAPVRQAFAPMSNEALSLWTDLCR